MLWLKKLFFINYKNQKNKQTSFIKRNYVRTFGFLLFLSIILLAFFLVDFSVNTQGFNIFKENIKDFFKVNNHDLNYQSNSILENSLLFLWQTFLFTTLGTFLGFAFALLTTFFGTKFLFSKILTFFVDLITIFLRSFPALIIIFAIKEGFEKSLAASMILFWFSWLWSSRYLQDIFNNSSLQLFHWYVQKGFSKITAFYKSVIFINLNKIIMIFFFSLEANLRFSAILGSFSLPGIGSLINQNFKGNHYENLAIPIFVLVGFIFVFELIIFGFNKWILVDKTKKIPQKYQNSKNKINFNSKKIIQMLFLLFFVAICVYQLTIMQYNFSLVKNLFIYLKSIFRPDLNLWSAHFSVNPWTNVLQLLLNGIVIIVICFWFSLLFSFFSCSKIMSPYVFLPFRAINILFRAIPVLIIFIFINPLFMNQTTIGIISICFGTSSVLIKQFSESFNQVSKEKIQMYRKQGKSLMWIFLFYMFFEVRKDLYAYAYFAYNNALRTLVVLGVFGVSIIGSKINGYQQRELTFKIASYIWPLVITLFTLEFVPVFNFYLKFWKENIKFKLLRINKR